MWKRLSISRLQREHKWLRPLCQLSSWCSMINLHGRHKHALTDRWINLPLRISLLEPSLPNHSAKKTKWKYKLEIVYLKFWRKMIRNGNARYGEEMQRIKMCWKSATKFLALFLDGWEHHHRWNISWTLKSKSFSRKWENAEKSKRVYYTFPSNAHLSLPLEH